MRTFQSVMRFLTFTSMLNAIYASRNQRINLDTKGKQSEIYQVTLNNQAIRLVKNYLEAEELGFNLKDQDAVKTFPLNPEFKKLLQKGYFVKLPHNYDQTFFFTDEYMPPKRITASKERILLYGRDNKEDGNFYYVDKEALKHNKFKILFYEKVPVFNVDNFIKISVDSNFNSLHFFHPVTGEVIPDVSFFDFSKIRIVDSMEKVNNYPFKKSINQLKANSIEEARPLISKASEIHKQADNDNKLLPSEKFAILNILVDYVNEISKAKDIGDLENAKQQIRQYMDKKLALVEKGTVTSSKIFEYAEKLNSLLEVKSFANRKTINTTQSYFSSEIINAILALIGITLVGVFLKLAKSKYLERHAKAPLILLAQNIGLENNLIFIGKDASLDLRSLQVVAKIELNSTSGKMVIHVVKEKLKQLIVNTLKKMYSDNLVVEVKEHAVRIKNYPYLYKNVANSMNVFKEQLDEASVESRIKIIKKGIDGLKEKLDYENKLEKINTIYLKLCEVNLVLNITKYPLLEHFSKLLGSSVDKLKGICTDIKLEITIFNSKLNSIADNGLLQRNIVKVGQYNELEQLIASIGNLDETLKELHLDEKIVAAEQQLKVIEKEKEEVVLKKGLYDSYLNLSNEIDTIKNVNEIEGFFGEVRKLKDDALKIYEETKRNYYNANKDYDLTDILYNGLKDISSQHEAIKNELYDDKEKVNEFLMLVNNIMNEFNEVSEKFKELILTSDFELAKAQITDLEKVINNLKNKRELLTTGLATRKNSINKFTSGCNKLCTDIEAEVRKQKAAPSKIFKTPDEKEIPKEKNLDEKKSAGPHPTQEKAIDSKKQPAFFENSLMFRRFQALLNQAVSRIADVHDRMKKVDDSENGQLVAFHASHYDVFILFKALKESLDQKDKNGVFNFMRNRLMYKTLLPEQKYLLDDMVDRIYKNIKAGKIVNIEKLEETIKVSKLYIYYRDQQKLAKEKLEGEEVLAVSEKLEFDVKTVIEEISMCINDFVKIMKSKGKYIHDYAHAAKDCIMKIGAAAESIFENNPKEYYALLANKDVENLVKLCRGARRTIAHTSQLIDIEDEFLESYMKCCLKLQSLKDKIVETKEEATIAAVNESGIKFAFT